MKKLALLMAAAILLMIPLHKGISRTLSARTTEEKIGFLPAKELMNIAALDHKQAVSEWLYFNVITYFGERTDQYKKNLLKTINYADMFRFLDASTYIDPYNIDSYYFAQAVFTWELGRIKEVNYLLERGLKYRTWDFYLPFFLGFNHYYFLKDYRAASGYMELASKISGDPLFTNLAARFFYEADETGVAVGFLKFMIGRTADKKVKQTLETRLKALEAAELLESTLRSFEKNYHRRPGSIDELISAKLLDRVPEDPYGGKFYLDEQGKIRTTSKFTFSAGAGMK